VGKSPNLDVVTEGQTGIVGVESKCTEFLCPHVAKFRPVYSDRFKDESPWSTEMRRLINEPTRYVWLDAAQLIKHAKVTAGQRVLDVACGTGVAELSRALE